VVIGTQKVPFPLPIAPQKSKGWATVLAVSLRLSPAVPLPTFDRKRPIAVLLAASVCAGVGVRLGVWQLDRAAQKQALQTALEARSTLPALSGESLARTAALALAQQYRPVTLQGEWAPDATVFLENRQMQGRPGFLVVTPLKLPGGEAVLVQRGWVARDAQNRSQVPQLPLPPGPMWVQGQVASVPGRLFALGADTAASSAIRQNIDMAQFARETRLTLLPLSVLQTGTLDDGLLRQWAAPALDIHKNYGYAFQWFALSALTLGLYVWFQIIRPRSG
jgi:surfeit locus 1 family protein